VHFAVLVWDVEISYSLIVKFPIYFCIYLFIAINVNLSSFDEINHRHFLVKKKKGVTTGLPLTYIIPEEFLAHLFSKFQSTVTCYSVLRYVEKS
jgi:hypothetical protein